MRALSRHRVRLFAVLAAAALAATACGGGGGEGGGEGLDGASFTVGSKEFTEQLILGQIAIQALEAAGAQVTDRTGITGTSNVRTALTAGEIDMYWEYTGTGWTTILGRESTEAPTEPTELFEAVRAADLANEVVWLEPAPLDNTYAIAVAQGTAEELGVKTLSDYAALVASDPAQARMCAAAEFLSRADGFPGLAEAYGFNLPADNIVELELSLIPPQVASGENCNFGEVFATDGAVAANNLVVLEDDLGFFVPYNAALTIRQEVFDQSPELAALFGPISAALTTDLMRSLNERVDVGGELPEQVAEQFLQENGFIS